MSALNEILDKLQKDFLETFPESTETAEKQHENRSNYICLDEFIIGRETALGGIKKGILNFINDVNKFNNPRILTLTGRSGTGKTLASRLILRNCTVKGARSEYYGRARNMHVGSCKMVNYGVELSKELNGEAGAIDYLRRFGLLILDDVFAEANLSDKYMSQYVSKLEMLVNMRMMDGNFTVISTNRSIEDIKQTEERLYSRLHRNGSEILTFATTDKSEKFQNKFDWTL